MLTSKIQLYWETDKVHANINITEDEANKIEVETREQHKSPSWYAVRAGRVTASQMHNVYIFNIDQPALSTVTNVCYPGQKKVID